MVKIFSLFREVFFQLTQYVVYVAKNFREFYFIIFLTFVVLLVEYLAASLMVPMAPGRGASGSLVTRVWAEVVEWMGLEPIFRTWLWLFCLMFTVRLALGYVLSILTVWLGKQVHKTLSRKVFGHILLDEPMEQVYARSIGHYIVMAGDDTFKGGTVVSTLSQASVGLLSAIVGMVVLYQFSPFLFAMVMLFLIACLSLMIIFIRQLVIKNAQSLELSRELNTAFIEALNSLRSIRTLHAQYFTIESYFAQISKYVRMLVEVEAIKYGIKIFPAVILVMIASIVLWPGHETGLTDIYLLAGTLIIIRVFASLGQMAASSLQMLTDLRAIKDINQLTSSEKFEIKERAIPTGEKIKNISLNKIRFGYGARGLVLDDICFRFEAGRTYAVVGESGSGKSTLADILLGLISPDSGSVTINDGILPLASAKSRFALVEQQPKIFSTSIKENLSMGQNFDNTALNAALATVNLEDMIKSLDEGLNTQLSYLGENLSGGQRQRLGIARALLRRPDVLILDEATSALDAITRVEVVKKIRNFMSNGIIIFITHHNEIADLADSTLVIKKYPQ